MYFENDHWCNMNNTNQQNEFPSREDLYRAYQRSFDHYKCVSHKILQKISHLLDENGIKGNVKSRIKSFESYYRKLLLSINHIRTSTTITDCIGIRVVCIFLNDLEKIQKLIYENFRVKEHEYKGSKFSAGEFGYQSIHMLIQLPDGLIKQQIPFTDNVFELQLRTKLQDAWAEAEHEIIYKSDESPLNDYLKRKLASINASLTLTDMIFQEIRDYQKTRQKLDDKRRSTLYQKLHAIQNLSMIENISSDTEELEDIRNYEKSPHDELHTLLINALDAHSKNDYDRALRLYTKIISFCSNDKICSIVYNHRGMVFFVISNYVKAVEDFSMAIEKNCKNARAYSNRGLTFRMLKRYDKAMDDFNRSVEIDALHIDGYFNRSQLNFELKNFPAALYDCEKVLEIKPDYQAAQKFLQIIKERIF